MMLVGVIYMYTRGGLLAVKINEILRNGAYVFLVLSYVGKFWLKIISARAL